MKRTHISGTGFNDGERAKECRWPLEAENNVQLTASKEIEATWNLIWTTT